MIKIEIGDRRGEGSSLGNLGIAYEYLQKYRKAIDYQEQSLKISREVNARAGEGRSLSNLGNVYYRIGERKTACDLWNKALTVFEAIESPDAKAVRKSLEEFCKS